MRIKNGLVFGADCKFSPRDIFFKNGTIVEEPGGYSTTGNAATEDAGSVYTGRRNTGSGYAIPKDASPKDASPEDTYDADGNYVLPGFIDIHTHGAMGYDMCDANPEGIEAMLAYHGGHGVTSVVLATMSYPEPVIAAAIQTSTRYFDKTGYGAVLRGVNLEGPYLSRNKCGAQNPGYLENPDLDAFERLVEVSQEHVRLVDLAPELPGAVDFIKEACKKCAVSLAHTEASYDVASAAFDAGASHVTHLFNAMPPFTHREPGVVGAAMEKAGFVELISDGVHIHPAAIRAAFRMFGEQRVCLISDSMRATGMPDGLYEIGGQAVRVENGRAALEGNPAAIAGSVVNLAEMCRRAVGFGIPVEHVVRAATLSPATAAGLGNEVGSLEPGKRADIVICDRELNVVAVFCAGKRTI